MRTQAVLAACVLMSGLAGIVRADEKPLARFELDRRVARVVYEASLLGSELWKAGNLEGCFHLYQGTLMAVQPLLDHRTKLAESVKERLDEAKDMKAADGAFVLRKALDAIQKETAEALAPQNAWQRLRGEAGTRPMIRDFLLAAAADPKVNLTHDGAFKFDTHALARLEQALVERISEATGGPLKVNPADQKAAIAGLKLTAEEFDATAGHLLSTLKEYQIGEEDAKRVLEAVSRIKSQIVRD